MKNKFIQPLLLLTLLFAWNCGPSYPDDTGQEPSYPVPEFSDPVLSFHDERGELHCRIKALYDQEITEITADLQLEGFDVSNLTITLNDSGALGDALPYDNMFTRNIYLNRIDSVNGVIRVRYSLYEEDSLLQDLFDTLNVIANLPPVITGVVMPDTIVRPLTGTKDLLIYVLVDDPNGVQDVIDGYFQVKSNTTGLWGSDYNLNDRGELGDAQAGDGIFSSGLQISSQNSAATNYFRFRVKDTAANFSAWSLDSVVVR